MSRRAPLLVAALLLAAVAFTTTLAAGAASAHAARVSTDPADNASVTTGPVRVSATFNEDLQTTFAAMTVVGPDGKLWAIGDPQVHGTVVSVGLRPLGPVGNYTVNYRVTSADGHVVAGSWSFRLTVPGIGHTRSVGAGSQRLARRPSDLAFRAGRGDPGGRRGTVGSAK